MKIFLTLSPSGNSSVPGSNTWINNLYEPLVDLGHEVFFLNIDACRKIFNSKPGTKIFKEKFSNFVLSKFKTENNKTRFDLFFSYFTDSHIYPDTIDIIKNLGVPTLNFSCNNTHQFYLTKEIATKFDYNLHSEKNAGEKFKQIGANAIWFQMAANPKYYHPIDLIFKYDVSFLGSSYGKRPDYIFNLLENKIDVHCFGPNWLINKPHEKIKIIYKEYIRFKDLLNALLSISKQRRYLLSSKIKYYDLQCFLRNKYSENMHYPLHDDCIVKLFNESKINLGFLEVFSNNNDTHLTTNQHLHLREFEIPMSGGLYITNHSDELAEHYEPDKEVLIFRNSYELIDKINFYLNHPKEADNIRKAGLKRALASHTYHKRFQDLFKILFHST